MVCRGGCRWVQLRIKEASDEEFISHAKDVQKVCESYGATFIVNDRVEIAQGIGADGVHLGRDDMPPAKARELLGRKPIIGATANSMEEVEKLRNEPIDYIGIGPYRETRTKEKLSAIMGPQRMGQIVRQARGSGMDIPFIAIGGIVEADIQRIANEGLWGLAICGHISRAEDPEAQTRNIIELINNNYHG
jgi:thiamine-phosphate diphosphorylase